MSGPRPVTESAAAARERVRNASDIVEVVGQYVTLKKAGRTWKGLCPFHQEKTPSFTVSPERQTFHCFGCGAGGDVFRFVQETERLTFPEALRHLAERAGIELPRWQGGDGESGRLVEATEEAAQLYRRALLDPGLGAPARQLLRDRGIGEDVEQRFGLGFAPAGWDFLSSRLERRFGREGLLQAGLVLEREGGGVYDRFRHRLMVPLRLPSGRTVGFGGRAVGGEEPKYLNSPETAVYRKGQFLFGLGEAREAFRAGQPAILVEGYFDGLVLRQAGFEAAVAAGGTAFTPEQARLLSRFVESVVVVFDGDAAGRVAARRALAPLLSAGLAVRVGSLPEKEDPDSFVRAHGAARFEAEILGSVQTPAALLCAAAGEGAEAHRKAVAAILELAAQIEGLPQREALFVEADRWLGTGVDRLRAEAAGHRPRPRAGTASPAGLQRDRNRAAAGFLERSLLALLAASEEGRREAATWPPEWLPEDESRAVFTVLVSRPEASAGEWLTELEPEARELLGRVLAEVNPPADARRTLVDHRRRLEARALQGEREVWRRRLAAGDVEAQQALRRMQDIAERLFALAGSEIEVAGKGERTE